MERRTLNLNRLNQSPEKNVFTGAYNQTYSGEVFKVNKRYHRGTRPVYKYENVKGTFYQSELQTYQKSNVKKI